MAGLWAITAFFNPMGSSRRLANYRAFRQELGAPLVTVEWSPAGEFQLRQDDADVLVQLAGGDLMWQKERLLNVALGHLPAACDIVAWLDCDIVFARSDWPEAARDLLDLHALVQLFTTVRYAPEDLAPERVSLATLQDAEPILTGDSLAHQLAVKPPGKQAIERLYGGQNDGLAWAAPKEMLLRHGFYDARIVGGGGMAIVRAAMGDYGGYVQERSLTASQTAHYLEWALPFHETVDGRIGCVDGCVFHLWHGHLSNRQYRVRQRKLNEFDFDPYRDIAMSESGCWRWGSNKPLLHEYVKDYFAERREDGAGA